MEYRVSRFPMLSRFFLTANEKDFSLSLEMTVRGKRYSRIASFPREKGFGTGCDSPSFLWKEVPRRGGGWLTQRNKYVHFYNDERFQERFGVRTPMEVRAASLHAKNPERFLISKNKRFQKCKVKFVA